MGELTKAATRVGDTDVEIYVYAKDKKIAAKEILSSAEEILQAAAKFTNGLPVNRYAFLFHFENKDMFSGGAWEHNYSSIYAFNEAPIEKMLQRDIVGTMAHEFFHIITPLNIHSELIEHFNFVKPQPSVHLWLYEGTTEWASKIMQLRGGLVSLPDYLKMIKQKLITDAHFRQDYSLQDLALNSFSVGGQEQYANIYHRGALVAGLLDLRLLELSGGKRGLREVINELSKKFGPQRAFSEKNFFQTFTDLTYPEIGDFFDLYVKQVNPLPIEEYFAKIGIDYSREEHTGKIDTTAGLSLTMKNQRIVFDELPPQTIEMGLRNGDEMIAVNNKPFTMQSFRQLFGEIRALGLDDPYTITVKRDGSEVTVNLKKFTREKIERHVFKIDDDANPAASSLRQAWLNNRAN